MLIPHLCAHAHTLARTRTFMLTWQQSPFKKD
uniref:Uncharacterized protein n=1 Tax=Anguilla anguilla TaxID=7936 RepID=A0A0E9VKT2_ANGAN